MSECSEWSRICSGPLGLRRFQPRFDCLRPVAPVAPKRKNAEEMYLKLKDEAARCKNEG